MATTTDSRPLHIYRKPIYPKRIISPENYISMPHTRCPSPKIPAPPSRRRHSTPPASALRFLEDLSPSSNKCLKYYYPNVKPTRVTRESSTISDPIKSRPTSIPLIKQRHQDKHNGYMPTTPSSMTSIPDVILPATKKNRSAIIHISSQIKSDNQSDHYKPSNKRQWKKCEQSKSLDLDRHAFISNDDSSEYSSGNYV